MGKITLDIVSNGRLIVRILTISILFIFLAVGNIGGCGGDGNGNGSIPPEVEEFTVFMNLWQLELSDGARSPCPKSSTDLELQLKLIGEEVSGEARLLGFSMIGNATELGGVVEDSSIFIDTFSVRVDDGRPPVGLWPLASVISFGFNSFIGTFSDADQDQTTDAIEVIASGRVTEYEADMIICSGDFTMELLADECVPSSFFPHSDCLAESISKACNFVTGCFYEYPDGVHADFWIGCGRQADCFCEVIDCNSLKCPLGPVTNLQFDPIHGLVGNTGLPDNPGIEFTCGTGFGP